MTKTPQQIKNEVEKEIEDIKINTCQSEDDYNYLCMRYFELKAQLSILTEYDKSIKEMILELILNKSRPDSYVKNLKIINVRDIEELLSKIGDNSEVEK